MLKELLNPVLDEVQKTIDELHEKDGLTDEVLELQVQVNNIRHCIDSPDTHEMVHEEYVQ